MLKSILFVIATLLAVLMFVGSIGEKDYRNKKLYAAMSGGMFVLALICAVA